MSPQQISLLYNADISAKTSSCSISEWSFRDDVGCLKEKRAHTGASFFDSSCSFHKEGRHDLPEVDLYVPKR